VSFWCGKVRSAKGGIENGYGTIRHRRRRIEIIDDLRKRGRAVCFFTEDSMDYKIRESDEREIRPEMGEGA
jgi:hypothetical protein